MTNPSKIHIPPVLIWIAVSLLTGIIVGYIRYWTGYYILLQGVLAGLAIPLVIHKTPSGNHPMLSQKSFKITLLLFFTFMAGQAVGFGFAQPWFDPAGWAVRVLNGDTSESIFGIFSTAGVVHGIYSEGVSGGFWILLSVIDLTFMFFFMLISISPKPIKEQL